MKIEKLKPGMTVYSVGRTKMGNTTLSTVGVWPVYIVSVDADKKEVIAQWNYNSERRYIESSWKKWREKQPMLIRTSIGCYRLATREETAEAKKSQGDKK